MLGKENKIHILHLVLSLQVGGAERVVCNLVKKQPCGNFRQTVCCLDEIGHLGNSLLSDGYQVDCLKRRPGIDWGLVFRLTRYCLKNEVSIIHSHGETPWFYAALASSVLVWRRLPCITTIHGYGGGDRREMKSYRLWKCLAVPTRKIVLVSTFFQNELFDAGLPSGKMLTVYNGVDGGCQPNEVFTRNLKGKIGISPEEFVIGIVARLSPIKNHALLLRAVKHLKTLVARPIRVLVVGDGPERKNLERLTAELFLEENVLFCGEQDNVYDFYSIFDLFVLPSFSEGISMTILEAMQGGVPVVASAVGGNLEIIDSGKNGLLFPSGNLDALVESVLLMMKDEPLAARLTHEAFVTVKEKFSLDVMLQAYRKVYREVLQ